MRVSDTPYRGDGERALLMDYLTEEFGDTWFVSNEVSHPLWNSSRRWTLRSQGLLVARPGRGPDPGFEYRVVRP